jgi:hypothetical protein
MQAVIGNTVAQIPAGMTTPAGDRHPPSCRPF